MWRRIFSFVAPIIFVTPLLIWACSQGKDSATFASNAAQGGTAEVEMGRLAAQRASDPNVKAFGERMISDHSKANAELKSVASKKGLQLPADLNSEQKSEID